MKFQSTDIEVIGYFSWSLKRSELPREPFLYEHSSALSAARKTSKVLNYRLYSLHTHPFFLGRSAPVGGNQSHQKLSLIPPAFVAYMLLCGKMCTMQQAILLASFRGPQLVCPTWNEASCIVGQSQYHICSTGASEFANQYLYCW